MYVENGWLSLDPIYLYQYYFNPPFRGWYAINISASRVSGEHSSGVLE